MNFSFQGKIFLAQRDSSGNALKPIWIGNAPELTLNLQAENSSLNESFSGLRLEVGNLTKAKKATLTMTLTDWSVNTLLLAMYGSLVQVASGSVTAEVLPSPAIGDFIRLAHPFISNVVVKNSAGSPATYVQGTDYSIESANAGILKILGTMITPPIKVDYDYLAIDLVTMFTSPPPERWLLLDGINTDNNEAVLVDLYRVKYNPAGNLSLITDDYGQIQLTGNVLADASKLNVSNLGGYGRAMKKQSVL